MPRIDPNVFIGGAVGSVLTGLVRALGIPSEIRAHDASISDRDDQLATWVADRNYALERQSKAVRAELPPVGNAAVAPGTPEATFEGQARVDYQRAAAEADVSIADLRGQALHEYRDEERRAKLDIAQILAPEGWTHAVVRKVWNRPAPALNTPDDASPVLDSWRQPSAMNPERYTWPDDATKRTLAEAVALVKALGP